MQLGFKCVRGNIPHDECRQCALNPLHPCEFTPDLLEMMRAQVPTEDEDADLEPGNDAFSPSRVLDCDRKSVLLQDADYYANIYHDYPKTRGHMVHSLMERARYPGALGGVREKRLYTTVETKYGLQRFTAKPDLIVLLRFDSGTTEVVPGDTLHVKIVDYKSKGSIEHSLVAAQPEHQMQVAMYAWLVQRELAQLLGWEVQVVVDEVEILYCDMKKTRRFTSAGPLETNGKMLKRKPPTYAPLALDAMVLHPSERIERFVRRRIEERLVAREVLPPVLDQEDAWRCAYCPVLDYCSKVAQERGEETPHA
jgi:CRISPR/Cas system-associated exonuclease Cas4 (RecB family)